MRIAFYAPLKPPGPPTASGDRTMARLLIAALERGGHEVTLAATLRSRDGAGDRRRQERLRQIGGRLAERFLRRARSAGRPPDLWFTYHLYYKAPDWIGPLVAEALAIPYVVAEASVAEKRRDGPWQLGHASVLAALRQADAVIGLNSADRGGLRGHIAPERWHPIKPFIAVAPFAAAAGARDVHRARLVARHALDPAAPWLVAVAMMRPGDKLASYRLLAVSLAALRHLPWRLIVIGDGAARRAVGDAFAPCADRIVWLGLVDAATIATTLAACDLFVWPAINEAYGMALLEAQAAGLPVLAGASGGVADVVADCVTGRLTPPGDDGAFTRALSELLAAPMRRQAFGAAAAARAALHDIDPAARNLDTVLRRVAGARPLPRTGR